MSDPSTPFQRLALLAATLALPGCSVFYDLNVNQCNVDADCAALGQELICGSDHICKADDTGCGTHAECLDRPGQFTESACIKEPSRTRGQCVDLKSPECPYVLPLAPENYAEQSLRNDDPLILGAFTTVTLSPFMLNFDLALTEVKDKYNGLSTQGGTRPVLMVACNGDGASSSNPDGFDQELDRAMDRLISLRVPGVVTGLQANDLQRVFEAKGHPANMFFMSVQESDRAFPAQDDDLLWHILPGGTSLARSYRPIVERTLAYLQSSGALTGPARIAQINTPDIRLLGDIAAAIQDSTTGIVFNGKTAVQNQLEDANYLPRTTPSVLADRDADLNAQVEELIAFKPHVIISLGATEFLTKILTALELQWSTRVPGQAPPFYILSPYQYRRPTLMTVLDSHPGVRARMIGVNAPASGNPDDYQQYMSRFAQYKLENADGFENFYDAAYYLLYAAAAARPGPSDGLGLAAGMVRLLSGPTFKVGPNDMPSAFNALRASPGATITLEGLMGPPKFDSAGGRDDAGAVWCITSTRDYAVDVLTYNDSDGSMQGSFPCFPNF